MKGKLLDGSMDRRFGACNVRLSRSSLSLLNTSLIRAWGLECSQGRTITLEYSQEPAAPLNSACKFKRAAAFAFLL